MEPADFRQENNTLKSKHKGFKVKNRAGLCKAVCDGVISSKIQAFPGNKLC